MKNIIILIFTTLLLVSCKLTKENYESGELKKLEELGFVSKTKGNLNKKSVYYLLEKRGLDTFPIMVEMAVFSTKHFLDHLGTTYTKEARTTMKTDRQGYISTLVSNYKKFKRNLVI